MLAVLDNSLGETGNGIAGTALLNFNRLSQTQHDLISNTSWENKAAQTANMTSAPISKICLNAINLMVKNIKKLEIISKPVSS